MRTTMRRKMNGLSWAESLVPRQNAISRVSFAKSLCPTLEDRVVPAPRGVRLSGNRFEPCDSATFHFQIHFRVAVRRGQAGMTQILADCRQVGPGLQQAYSCAVPHTVIRPFVARYRSSVRTVPAPWRWILIRVLQQS